MTGWGRSCLPRRGIETLTCSGKSVAQPTELPIYFSYLYLRLNTTCFLILHLPLLMYKLYLNTRTIEINNVLLVYFSLFKFLLSLYLFKYKGRCSLVSHDGAVLLDMYVQPTEPITTYRTRWSGITKGHMKNAIPHEFATAKIFSMLQVKTRSLNQHRNG